MSNRDADKSVVDLSAYLAAVVDKASNPGLQPAAAEKPPTKFSEPSISDSGDFGPFVLNGENAAVKMRMIEEFMKSSGVFKTTKKEGHRNRTDYRGLWGNISDIAKFQAYCAVMTEFLTANPEQEKRLIQSLELGQTMEEKFPKTRVSTGYALGSNGKLDISFTVLSASKLLSTQLQMFDGVTCEPYNESFRTSGLENVGSGNKIQFKLDDLENLQLITPQIASAKG